MKPSDLTVGQEVWVSSWRGRATGWEIAYVKKIGRKLVTIGPDKEGQSWQDKVYRLDDQHINGVRYGDSPSFRTKEQHEEVERRAKAREALERYGIRVGAIAIGNDFGTSPLPTETLEVLVRVLHHREEHDKGHV